MKFLYCVIMVLLLAACQQQDLLVNLNQDQANEVLAVLQRHNISAEKLDRGKNGYTIQLDKEDFPAAVDLLKIFSLPSRENVEVSDLFPADTLVSSPRAEKARLYSAIEQRLEQSLRKMNNLTTARVHVSYDIEAGEHGRAPSPVHLSVLAVYNADERPEPIVNDIKRFLVNTFADVKYENISVVLTRQSEIQQQAPTPRTNEKSVSPVKFVVPALVTTIVLALIAGSFLCRRKGYDLFAKLRKRP